MPIWFDLANIDTLHNMRCVLNCNTEFNLPIVTYTGARVGCHYWEVSLTKGKCAAFLLYLPPVPEHSRKSVQPSYCILHLSHNILKKLCSLLIRSSTSCRKFFKCTVWLQHCLHLLFCIVHNNQHWHYHYV